MKKVKRKNKKIKTLLAVISNMRVVHRVLLVLFVLVFAGIGYHFLRGGWASVPNSQAFGLNAGFEALSADTKKHNQIMDDFKAMGVQWLRLDFM